MNNKDIHSRREFFKQTAKGLLPIIGGILMLSVPSIAHAERPSSDCKRGCQYGCYNTCYGSCRGGCTCCKGGCSNSCTGCDGSCYLSCTSCRGNCTNSSTY